MNKSLKENENPETVSSCCYLDIIYLMNIAFTPVPLRQGNVTGGVLCVHNFYRSCNTSLTLDETKQFILQKQGWISQDGMAN